LPHRRARPPPAANVGANQVGIAQITPGRTLENITLKLGGTSFTEGAHVAAEAQSERQGDPRI
jgi:hypothetical protein